MGPTIVQNGTSNSLDFFENISKSIMKQWLKFGPIDVFGLSKTSNGLDLDLGTHKIQKMNKKKWKVQNFNPSNYSTTL